MFLQCFQNKYGQTWSKVIQITNKYDSILYIILGIKGEKNSL